MIIVIGATSFVGVHTVTELLNQGSKVLVTGRKNRFKEHYDALGVEYVKDGLKKTYNYFRSHLIKQCSCLSVIMKLRKFERKCYSLYVLKSE